MNDREMLRSVLAFLEEHFPDDENFCHVHIAMLKEALREYLGEVLVGSAPQKPEKPGILVWREGFGVPAAEGQNR